MKCIEHKYTHTQRFDNEMEHDSCTTKPSSSHKIEFQNIKLYVVLTEKRERNSSITIHCWLLIVVEHLTEQLNQSCSEEPFSRCIKNAQWQSTIIKWKKKKIKQEIENRNAFQLRNREMFPDLFAILSFFIQLWLSISHHAWHIIRTLTRKSYHLFQPKFASQFLSASAFFCYLFECYSLSCWLLLSPNTKWTLLCSLHVERSVF